MPERTLPYSTSPELSNNGQGAPLDDQSAKRTGQAAFLLHRLGVDINHSWQCFQLIPYLETYLESVGNVNRVFAGLARLKQSAADFDALLTLWAENPRRLEVLTRIFAGSQFLTDILLKEPDPWNRVAQSLQPAPTQSAEQYCLEALQAIQNDREHLHFSKILRRYQRQELLRIGINDLLGLLDLDAVTRQLSNLAEGLVDASLQQVALSGGLSAKDFVIIGLGKLGGKELNYSSDIDLLFIVRQDPMQYLRLGEKLIAAISNLNEEGFLYRIDMRLRPWGKVGPLVSSLTGYLNYLQKHARHWEKQALLKARVIAGDRALGQTFLDAVQDFLFEGAGDSIRSSVYEMKLRTEKMLRIQGKDYGEVKLGQGSIRDIEFIVQYLQLVHGKTLPEIRKPNTLEAIQALQHAGLLPADEARILNDGYIFLRVIEHYLQLNDYQQTHRLPTQPEALEDLGRRLGFSSPHASADLMTQFLQHSAAIRSIFLRHIGNETMSNHHPSENSNSTNEGLIHQHLRRMDPSYGATFTPQEIQRHAEMSACLDRDHPLAVEAQPMEDGYWRVTIVAYDYLGELSLICGMMFVYGLNIHSGEVFTYEPLNAANGAKGLSSEERRKKIVDVFIVQPKRGEFPTALWNQYTQDLTALLKMMERGENRLARGELAKRVATIYQDTPPEWNTLYPIEIEINNDISERYTVLRIDSIDTLGFLYELTNALAYSRIYIARMTIETIGNRVRDVLYISDDKGRKVTDSNRLRELRAAIVLIKHFTHLLPHSPNPVSALLHFRDFIAQLFERPNWTEELTSLEKPAVLEGLARLLGVSDFLWDDFLRLQYANLFPVVRDVDALSTAKTRQQLQAEMEAGLRLVHAGPQPPSEDAPWIQFLNQFKDREMFRIDMRHILGHTQEFWEFADELTDLAEVIVNAAYHLTAEDLRSVYGTPLREDGRVSQMSVIALGKCGGRELGFASDIELMFVYDGNGLTTGPEKITSAEFHEKTVQQFIKAIHARREGIFEIDLQLRPYGKAGSLAVSLEAFRRYFSPEGPAWAYERQALVKLRAIAGDQSLGQLIEALRDEYVYSGAPFDVAALRAMRQRQIRHLVHPGRFHPKFSPGGLIDIEYLVQALQIRYGHQHPALRVANTRQAMRALWETGILTDDDYAKLRKAHTFLRWLIDALRMVRGNAKEIHLPSPDSEEFAYLARRLRFGNDLQRLQADLATHTAHVLALNARLLR